MTEAQFMTEARFKSELLAAAPKGWTLKEVRKNGLIYYYGVNPDGTKEKHVATYSLYVPIALPEGWTLREIRDNEKVMYVAEPPEPDDVCRCNQCKEMEQ